MPEAVMQEGRNLSDPDPQSDHQSSPVAMGGWLDPLDALGPPGHIGDRAEIEKELDLIAAAIRTFYRKQPDMVMREAGGFSARLTEMAVLLHRVEGLDRQYTRIRTQQVERFLTELDRQFKTASRLIEVQRQDIELMR